MSIRGSPDGFGKVPSTLRGPLVVSIVPPLRAGSSLRNCLSTRTAPSSERKAGSSPCSWLFWLSHWASAISGRMIRSKKGSMPRRWMESPRERLRRLSKTGASHSTAGSRRSSMRRDSSIGPTGRWIEWVAFPRRNSTALVKLFKAVWAERVIPTTAATPQATPINCSKLRLNRLGR